MTDLERTLHNLTNQTPTTVPPERWDAVRAPFKDAARAIYENCPASRERSLALTALEEACMWAIGSIARNVS